MFANIRKIVIVLLIVTIATAVIVQNSGTITVQLTPNNTIEAMSGVILIFTFTIGFLVAGLFGLIYGIRSYFRERGLKHKEQVAQKFYQEMLKARSAEAAGEYKKAISLWEALIKKDPSDIIARVELSKALSMQGETDEALRALDKARAADPTNIEVLLRAADCNVALGNKTAALDNLALALYHHPHKEAARRARDLSEEIDRINDAIEYHDKFEEYTGKTEENLSIGTKLYFKKLLNEHKEEGEKLEALRKFIKRNTSYPPAIAELARMEKAAGNIDTAAELLLKAAKKETCPRYWIEAIKLWLDNDDTERALATAKTSCRQNSGKSRVFLESNYIRLLLDLQKQDEAKAALEKLPKIAEEEGVELDAMLKQQIAILTGYSAEQSGEHSAALSRWRTLSDGLFGGALMKKIHELGSCEAPGHPSPKLSTP